jgi:hypothetical protein
MIADTILNDYSETFCMMDETTVSDGYGSFDVVWVEGAEFKASIAKDAALTAQIAQAQTEIKRYRITTAKNVTLLEGKYVKWLKDGTTYKILHSNTDKLAPTDSNLSGLRSTTMERAVLPT